MNRTRRARLALALTAALAATTAAVVLPSTASAAAPAPGAEKAITAARPANAQTNAAVAWNGTLYLVVWEEHFADGSPAAIFGARVSSTGTVLDPNGFRISAPDEFDPRLDPAVAAGPNGFMVVYEHAPEGTYTDLDAAIVGANGTLVRPEWRFRSIDNDQVDPAIAWNGSRFLVTWQDGPDPTDADIFAARAFADGRSFDGCSFESCLDDEVDWPGIPIYATLGAVADSNQTSPVVAATNDAQFHLAWQDTETTTKSDIRGTRFRLGAVVDDPPYTVSGASADQTEPAIAANGGALLTAWTDRRGGGGRDIWGDVGIAGAGADFRISGATGAQYEPAVTSRGTGFLVAWTDTRNGNADIYTSRVTATGVVSEPAGVAASRAAVAETQPALASGSGNRQLLVYTKANATGDSSRIMLRLIA